MILLIPSEVAAWYIHGVKMSNLIMWLNLSYCVWWTISKYNRDSKHEDYSHSHYILSALGGGLATPR